MQHEGIFIAFIAPLFRYRVWLDEQRLGDISLQHLEAHLKTVDLRIVLTCVTLNCPTKTQETS